MMLGRWLVFSIFVNLLLAPLEARATGGIVGSSEEAVDVEAKIAVAIAPSRTTRWLSLRVKEATPIAIWLLPLRPDARVDVSSPIFLEGLEDATLPRILPPAELPSCFALPELETYGDLSHHPTHRPTEIRWLETEAETIGYAASLGLGVSAEMEARIEALSQEGHRFLAMTHTVIEKGSMLGPLRIVDDSTPVLPLFLSRAKEDIAMKVTAFVLGQGQASFGETPPSAIAPFAIVWHRNGRSNYEKLRDDSLAAGHGERWIYESAGHDLVFSATDIPYRAKPIPSLVDAYLARAAGDHRDCARAIAAFANRQEIVGNACAPGALAAEAKPCVESPRPGEIAPAAFRCDGAEELAFAFSGLRPREVVLTRAVGIVEPSAFGSDVAISLAKGEDRSPLVETWTHEPCEKDDKGTGPHPETGGPSPSPPTWTPPPLSSEEGEGEWIESTNVVFGCGSSSETEYDDWDSEGCGSGAGGGVDAYDSDDESCDSGGYGGSEGEDEGEGCEGGSGGYEGSDEEEEECSIAKGRKRRTRPRLSVYTLTLAAFALPIRRWARRRQNGGEP